MPELTFDDVVRFHGHACPGLALGYRVAELVLKRLGERAVDEELVAVVENNSCAVDAIQVMLGCTFGKGNLIFRDYGKQVYTVMTRPSGEGLRIAINWEPPPESAAEKEAWEKYRQGERSEEIARVVHDRKARKMQAILDASPEELFTVGEPREALPEAARIYPSLTCERCDEKVMAPRTRQRDGKTVCIPCSDF